MNATVQKWGNSLALRIPSRLAKEIRLRRGSAVEVAVEEGGLVVRPAKRRQFALSSLLKAVTKDNRHEAAGWGDPAGKESW